MEVNAKSLSLLLVPSLLEKMVMRRPFAERERSFAFNLENLEGFERGKSAQKTRKSPPIFFLKDIKVIKVIAVCQLNERSKEV